jgi:predicted RNA-binding protein with PUA-like domain
MPTPAFFDRSNPVGKFWLFKSDLEDYPLEQFVKDKVTPWEGVRNYQARNFMMKDMKLGDKGFFYLSNAKPSAVVALLEVVSAPKADRLAFNPKSEYFDEASTPDKPRWMCVDVKYVQTLRRPVSLEDLRKEKSLASMQLLQRGNRLSILPLTEGEYKKIIALSQT